MKEVLTKKFWQDVKKTFDEAREEPASNASDPGYTAIKDVTTTPSSPEPPGSKTEVPNDHP